MYFVYCEISNTPIYLLVWYLSCVSANTPVYLIVWFLSCVGANTPLFLLVWYLSYVSANTAIYLLVWFLSCVGANMYHQCPFIIESLVALMTESCVVLIVSAHVTYQHCSLSKAFTAQCAQETQIGVDVSHVVFQSSSTPDNFATFRAFLSIIGTWMYLLNMSFHFVFIVKCLQNIHYFI